MLGAVKYEHCTWQGFEAAMAAGAKEIAVFTAASESFAKANINCTIEESLARYRQVCDAAKEQNIPIRGCVLSTTLYRSYLVYSNLHSAGRNVQKRRQNFWCIFSSPFVSN